MVKKSDNKKNTILYTCIGAVVVVVLIIIGVLLFRQGPNQLGSDAFFKSDNAKYVISINSERMSIDEEEPEPVKSYLVYFYTEDKITDFKTYQEYANEGIAKTAYNYFQDTIANLFKEVTLDGRYVIFTHEESDYEGITAQDVQMQIEYNEALSEEEATPDMESDETEPADETSTEETPTDEDHVAE